MNENNKFDVVGTNIAEKATMVRKICLEDHSNRMNMV